MNNEEQLQDGLEDEYVEEETLEEESLKQEFDIPEKFKDKTLEDVVKSYQELEKAYGQRGNDIGELRRLSDQLLEQQLQSKKEPEVDDHYDVDMLLEDPEAIINKAVSKATKPLEDKLRQYELAKEREAFERKHPDYADIITKPDFQEWIMASPTRHKLLLEADKNADYATGSEILDLYKQINHVETAQKKEVSKQKRETDLKKASVESGTAGTPSKKKFSRKHLIHLKITDPAKYESMLPEIKLAYAEGRIRD